MSEDNKTVAVTETTETQKPRGDRGEVGTATASLTIKQRWHAAHFKLVDASDGQHPNRQSYVRNKDTLSLRAFARQLAKRGDANAKEWFANKVGDNRQERSDANIKLAKACASATKLSRKKSKGGGGKAKASTEAVA